MSISSWEAYASFSKNTFYGKASGSALFSVCSQFSTNFQACVLINFFIKKSVCYHFSPGLFKNRNYTGF